MSGRTTETRDVPGQIGSRPCRLIKIHLTWGVERKEVVLRSGLGENRKPRKRGKNSSQRTCGKKGVIKRLLKLGRERKIGKERKRSAPPAKFIMVLPLFGARVGTGESATNCAPGEKGTADGTKELSAAGIKRRKGTLSYLVRAGGEENRPCKKKLSHRRVQHIEGTVLGRSPILEEGKWR